MNARLRHRGPDGEGSWLAAREGWQVALGHRRLSIIDLEGGRQPLGNEDGTVQITFNGEIYDFSRLRAGLEARGHRFATRSDTEVIVHHWEERGPKGLSELNGMFAFAIWDQKDGSLTLARDRVGIKPLFYAPLADGGLAFASELTALLELAETPRRLDRESLGSYFFVDYVPPVRSLVSGVRKLEPGTWLRWKDGKLEEPARFWRLGDARAKPLAGGDSAHLARELEERAAEAVRRQLVADVPVGIFLSGGIDSSSVAALAQRQLRQPVRTFSIAFEDPAFDESSYARQVARHLRSDHTEETLSEAILLDTVDAALGSLDEPVADPSIVPTYLLSRLAARHVKVALGGDGGDELWAGYPTYRAHVFARLYGAVPESLREGVIAPLVSRLPVADRYQSFEWKAKRFTGRWASEPSRRHLRWMSNTDLPDLANLVPALAGNPPPLGTAPLFESDVINSMLALDFRTYLPGSVLAKVDRASMAHGLEVRPPLLDNELVDWAFSLPSRVKLHGTTGKYLLKKAVRGLLPAEVVDRPKKGFAIPLASWLRGPLAPLVEAALRDSPLWASGEPPLGRECLDAWWTEHRERRRDRSRGLWALVVLDRWMKRERIAA
jgi:asparagine synthase (glutamine-hydrolysing)